MSIERVNTTIDGAQMAAVKFLVYFFVFLVALLGIVFGGAIMFVCQGCAVMRQVVMLVASMMAQAQGQRGEYDAEQAAHESAEQSRRAWAFAEQYGLHMPCGGK